MKFRIVFTLIMFFVISGISCKQSTESEGPRTGAVCKDGSTTTATGSGACSSHGGVSYWLYK